MQTVLSERRDLNPESYLPAMLRINVAGGRTREPRTKFSVGMPGFEPGVSRTRIVNVTVTPRPDLVLKHNFDSLYDSYRICTPFGYFFRLRLKNTSKGLAKPRRFGRDPDFAKRTSGLRTARFSPESYVLPVYYGPNT